MRRVSRRLQHPCRLRISVCYFGPTHRIGDNIYRYQQGLLLLGAGYVISLSRMIFAGRSAVLSFGTVFVVKPTNVRVGIPSSTGAAWSTLTILFKRQWTSGSTALNKLQNFYLLL